MQTNKFLPLLVLVVVLVQGGSCGPISDLEDGLLTLIRQLLSDISGILTSVPDLIKNTLETVNSLLGGLEKDVVAIIEGLTSAILSDISSTVSEAEELGKDVSSCVNDVTASIVGLNVTDIISVCVPHVDIKGILELVNGLGSAVTTVVGSLGTCLVENLLNIPAFGDCVLQDIGDAQEQLNGVLAQLGSLVDILPQLRLCVNVTLDTVTSELNSLQEDFDDCARGILDTASSVLPTE